MNFLPGGLALFFISQSRETGQHPLHLMGSHWFSWNWQQFVKSFASAALTFLLTVYSNYVLLEWYCFCRWEMKTTNRIEWGAAARRVIIKDLKAVLWRPANQYHESTPPYSQHFVVSSLFFWEESAWCIEGWPNNKLTGICVNSVTLRRTLILWKCPLGPRLIHRLGFENKKEEEKTVLFTCVEFTSCLSFFLNIL